MRPIKTVIEHDGQPYVDEPIYDHLAPKKMALEVSLALKIGNIPKTIHVLKGYQHVKLRWMKPDGKGELIPR